MTGLTGSYVPARRIARRMRHLGFRAEQLGQFDDQAWEAARYALDCEDATNLELADAVDVLIAAQEGLTDLRQIIEVDPALDNYGLIG